MTPNTVLALYTVMLGSAAWGALGLLQALGLDWAMPLGPLALLWAGHWWFTPRYRVYRRAFQR